MLDNILVCMSLALGILYGQLVQGICPVSHHRMLLDNADIRSTPRVLLLGGLYLLEGIVVLPDIRFHHLVERIPFRVVHKLRDKIQYTRVLLYDNRRFVCIHRCHRQGIIR